MLGRVDRVAELGKGTSKCSLFFTHHKVANCMSSDYGLGISVRDGVGEHPASYWAESSR